MALRLKTKFTLTTALLVLAVVAVNSAVYVATLTRQVIGDADARARFVAQQVFLQAQHALEDAASEGQAPASSRPEDLREYVRQALDENAGLTSLIDAAVGYSKTIYEVTVADTRHTALISSDASLPGQSIRARPLLEELLRAGFAEQLRLLYGPPRVYEVVLPFNLGAEPFGEIRIGLSTIFLRDEISASLKPAALLALGAVLLSTLLAAALSHISLAPLDRITAQLDRIQQGEAELEPVRRGDELGQVSTKISQIGQQLRGVREIFSTLRENLNQLMTGLEDGLLLFTRDGRAVMASPSVEKYLGARADALLGKRVEEVFPPGSRWREVLQVSEGQLEPLEAAEVRLDGAERRVGLSVHVITEHGSRMGALVRLRDLESLERIGSELQVSERLAAIGKITAGVAHEVKNPLNSMRLWLENLKESLALDGGEGTAPDPEGTQQAVKILDNEIDRLDRVVKTFLDFARPVALRLEPVPLQELLGEVAELSRPEAQRAGAEVVLEAGADVPPARADRQLLKQAVLNLALNGCEIMREHAEATGAAPGGKLTLGLRRAGEMAELRVGDTGPGIAPEHRAKIFQLFFTTKKGGSGIGLATTFRIVQMHGGSIDFESAAGRGTTFRIEVPLARS